MKTRNKLLTMMMISVGTAVATATINKGIKLSAISKNVLAEPESLTYNWRFGKIHYTKIGNGKPILLIHDLTIFSSGYEWNQLIHYLKESYTVYTIDLIGCGRSDKPDLTYTNYLYVQLISDFIKSEIGHRTDVIATGGSAAIAIMACNHSSELFNRLMLINPDSILACSQIPNKHGKIYKFILDLPIVGSLLYHIASSKQAIRDLFNNKYLYNPYNVKATWVDSYYESAHLGRSPKSVFASIQCNYTKCNIITALKKIDNSIYLVGGDSIKLLEDDFREYKEYNPAIEYGFISGTKYLPQLEDPNELIKMIQVFFA